MIIQEVLRLSGREFLDADARGAGVRGRSREGILIGKSVPPFLLN